MKQKILLIAFIILHFTFFIRLSADDTWLQVYQPGYDQFENPPGYEVQDLMVCPDGGYAVFGTVLYIVGLSELYEDAYIMKTDSDGNMLWFQRYTINGTNCTEGRCAAVAHDGGFLFCINNTIVVKTDSEGNEEYRYTFNDFGLMDILPLDDGNYFITGMSYIEYSPGYRKITPEFNTIWHKEYVFGNRGFITASNSTQEDGFILTGWYEQTTINSNLFAIKTDAEGDSLWTITYDGFGDGDRGIDIVESPNENILVSGYSTEPLGASHGIAWLFDPDGNTIWQSIGEYGNYRIDSIYSLNDNSFLGNASSSELGCHIYKFDQDYEIEWITPLEGGTSGRNNGFAVLDSDYIIQVVNGVEHNEGGDIGLYKLDPDGNYSATDDNVIELPEENLTNYPNPFNPTTKIEFETTSLYELTQIEVFNVRGQKVKTLLNEPLVKGIHSVVWNGDDSNGKAVASGVYYYRMVSGNYQKIKKMILLK